MIHDNINNIIMSKIIRLSDKYKLISKIGSGSFGEVYEAKEKKSGKYYASKIEKKKKGSRLKDEYNIYMKLKNNGVITGIPKVYEFLETSEHNILIMQILGKSLDEMLTISKGNFNIGTVLKLGIGLPPCSSIHSV